MAPHLSIIIPVYNEGDNFPSLWARLSSQIRCDFTAFVIYDFDEDDTLPVIERLIARGEKRIHLVKNNVRAGVVGAILSGFNQIDDGPILVLMADLSDDLSQVDSMLALYQRGYQVVVGSRYMKGGRLEGGPRFKQFLSRMAGLTLCWFRGIPTHDATNAFKIYDRGMLKSFVIESQAGFELNLELTVKAFLAGYHIAEVPATWRARGAGKSRFRLWAWLPRYLRWYFYAFQPRRARRPLGTMNDRAERR
jgi:glycosyltransferase involved in cell wall biosynthesis